MKINKTILYLLLFAAVAQVSTASAYTRACRLERHGARRNSPFATGAPHIAWRHGPRGLRRGRRLGRSVAVGTPIRRCYIKLEPEERTFVKDELEALDPTLSVDQAIEETIGMMKGTVPTPYERIKYRPMLVVLMGYKRRGFNKIDAVLNHMELVEQRYKNIGNKNWLTPQMQARIRARRMRARAHGGRRPGYRTRGYRYGGPGVRRRVRVGGHGGRRWR